ncbi:hypothetical protein [Ancylomarina longa]|uniref:hypothetical protein n=1 Tax=Ancylomarina longa TaxID=2487017 RepID=UPI001ADEA66D|nr:hypothetical protein [Ancylomarina longa]
MKNLEEFGVQKMNAQELKITDGGRIPIIDDAKDTFWEFVEGIKDGWEAANKN